MRRIVWSNHAHIEFRDIITFIAERDPTAAGSVADRIDSALNALANMPTGRQGRVGGTYEKVVSGTPYIIAYALRDTPGQPELVVLHVIHSARDWREGAWPKVD